MTLPPVRSVDPEPIVYNDIEPMRVQTRDDDTSLFSAIPASRWGPMLEKCGSQKGLGDAWLSFLPTGVNLAWSIRFWKKFTFNRPQDVVRKPLVNSAD